MKKILSILAAVGLTATASTAVVACTTTVSGKNVDVTRTASDGSYTITTKDFKVKLSTGIAADVKKGDTIAKADLAKDFGHLVWFKGKDPVKFTTGKLTDESVTAEKDIKKGDKSIKISMKFVLDQKAAIDLGLVDANGKAGKNVTLTLATVDKNNKKDKTLFDIKFEAKKFAFTK